MSDTYAVFTLDYHHYAVPAEYGAEHVMSRDSRARARRARWDALSREFTSLSMRRDLPADVELWATLQKMGEAWADDLDELLALYGAVERLDPHPRDQVHRCMAKTEGPIQGGEEVIF